MDNEDLAYKKNYKTTLLSPHNSHIKPLATEDDVRYFCKVCYGLEEIKMKQLDGYDDLNFWIVSCSIYNNQHIKNKWPHGYVLKILNSIDSLDCRYIEGQNKLLLHLGESSFNAPQPVKNIHGNYFSLEVLKGDNKKKHAIRLLTYQAGNILKEIPVDNEMAFNLGAYLYKLDECLKNFDNKAFKDHSSVWQLDKVSELWKFTSVVTDSQKLSIVKQSIKEFELLVLPQMDILEKGIIHGDFNEQNILVAENDFSILDFGDSHYGPYLFEVAIGLCYIILLTEKLEVAKYFYDGFTKEKGFSEHEARLIKVCVKARLCQSLVLGLYSYNKDPNNKYILNTQKTGWKMLKILSEKDYIF